jgi:hypothetical protein
MLQELTRELGQDMRRTVMIGDTTHDLLMANNAGRLRHRGRVRRASGRATAGMPPDIHGEERARTARLADRERMNGDAEVYICDPMRWSTAARACAFPSRLRRRSDRLRGALRRQGLRLPEPLRPRARSNWTGSRANSSSRAAVPDVRDAWRDLPCPKPASARADLAAAASCARSPCAKPTAASTGSRTSIFQPPAGSKVIKGFMSEEHQERQSA